MKRVDPLRVVIALGCLAIGGLHLRLWFDSYRDVPDVGRSFLVNAAASLVTAAVVLFWSHRLALLAPILLANSTLLAFGLSRTDRGIFNFTEQGWNPSPDAALSVAVETVTAVLAVLALYRERPLSTS